MPFVEPPVTGETLRQRVKGLGNRLTVLYRFLFPAGVVSKVRSPFASGHTYEAAVPLTKKFRFVHEPVVGTTSTRFVGREIEMQSLAQRILFSKGGSFLVTGYRGVGKTSFVNQVVRTLELALPWAEGALGKTEIVDIYLNVARPVEPSEIMHHIIRRLRERLIEKDFYRLLDKKLREDLTLPYDRTSVNMARKLAESSERTFGFDEASIGSDWMKAAVKLGWSSKRSKTQNYEMSYLGCDDKAAEHDIIRISRQLADGGYSQPTPGWRRHGLIFWPREPQMVRLKIVFVFDELDKLEEFNPKGGKGKKPVIDEILGALKNLFTTSGVTFVFVAGKDLQERWLDDVGKGDSVYESVFSYDKYLPCLWSDVDPICNALLADSVTLPSYDKQVYEEFKKYLVFKGRGIPRRIIRTFNDFVGWNGEQPVLAFTRQAVRQIRFFAGLQEVLTTNEKLLFGESHEEVPGAQSDKRRLLPHRLDPAPVDVRVHVERRFERFQTTKCQDCAG
ncbi:MAG: ATP-binding protein [Pseudomonadota bacterium]|nr:ATP-binding protein [Pseudomonadota bacterium]